jgi:hypothetical protein
MLNFIASVNEDLSNSGFYQNHLYLQYNKTLYGALYKYAH